MDRVAVVVTLVVILAGCNGFVDERPETMTPAPVPTATPVGEGSTVDAERIAGRHQRTLQGRSYTVTVASTVHYDNGSTGRLRDRFVVGSDERYRWTRRVTGPYPGPARNHTAWRSEDRSAIRETLANGTTTVDHGGVRGPGDPSLSFFVARLLGGFEVSATRTADGRRLYGTDRQPPEIPLPIGLSAGREGSVHARITDGYVRTLVVRSRARSLETDQAVWVRLEILVGNLGGPAPTEPAWVVPEATATTTATTNATATATATPNATATTPTAMTPGARSRETDL